VARILPFFPINSTNFSASRNESVLLEMLEGLRNVAYRRSGLLACGHILLTIN
jgi:hypothetical protein